MGTPDELRVFISSTFRDLQEEREHLVKKIFPEIRALCRERGVTFTEIDLRWGVTEQQIEREGVIKICLDEIDRCRPYFIGITGDRYGYVPDLTEYHKDPDLIRRWPWITEAAARGASILDLEFQHAVLNHPCHGDTSARFYFRKPNRLSVGDASAESTRLQELKNRVYQAGLIVQEYSDPRSLGAAVYRDLIQTLDRDFAVVESRTPLNQERARHRAFAASRVHGYVPNPKYVRQLEDWYASDDQQLVLHAGSGCGKSSLAAFWCNHVRVSQPDVAIIEHYIGVGAGDADHLGLINHVMSEIKSRFERTEEVPSKQGEMERDFANWLGFGLGHPVLLVIDGLDQLMGHALDLHWLPPVMPPGLKLLISSTGEKTLTEFRRRGWSELDLVPLNTEERETVVVQCLGEYHKTLPAHLARQIAHDPKSAHPLFLRTLVEELRLHGNHEELENVVASLLATDGTDGLFQRVLDRLEHDYSEQLICDVLTSIWASRQGLGEEELVELTGIGRLNLSTLLPGLDYHLVRHDGLLGFFHSYLRRAVEARYLLAARNRNEAHERLAVYFRHADATLRATRELLHALEQLGLRKELEDTLLSIERFDLLWQSDEYEVLRLWSIHQTDRVGTAYVQQIDAWAKESNPGTEELGRILAEVASLCVDLGAWDEAEHLLGRQISSLMGTNRRSEAARVMTTLSAVLLQHGRVDEAEGAASESEQIARELNDRNILGIAVTQRGLVRYDCGDYVAALDWFSEGEQLATEDGDRQALASAVGNRGLVQWKRGEYVEALDCFARQEQIVRERGDRRSLARVIGNRGLVQWNRGGYADALASFSECERIARALGNRRMTGAAVGNRGLVLSDRGDNAEALACHKEHERIARELGDRVGLASALGNRGLVHTRLGEADEALNCYAGQEAICQELGDRSGLASAYGNRGLTYFNLGMYDEALDNYAKQEALVQELGERGSVASCAGNRALIHSIRGEYDEALTCFALQEEIARELGDRNGLAVAIGNRATALWSKGDYAEALDGLRIAADEHLALGNRSYHTHWLNTMANVMVDIVEEGGHSVPEYLTAFVHDLDIQTHGSHGDWRIKTLGFVRTLLDQHDVAPNSGLNRDRSVDAGVLLARVVAAEGNRASATAMLQSMLRDRTRPDEPATSLRQVAELHYRLWKLDPSDSQHRTEALRLHQSLLESSPWAIYRHRIEEMEGVANPERGRSDGMDATQ